MTTGKGNRICRLLGATLLLAGCSVTALAGELPPFVVEAGDGVIRFDNVSIREHPYAGATLFNAVAVNRTGCDFRSLEVDLIFVAGEGDRFDRVTLRNFKDGSAVPLADRRLPGPSQEIQTIRGIALRSPMVCARAVAEEKAAKERKAREIAQKGADEAAARQKAAADKSARIAAVAAKPFKTGFGGLFLGMSVEDLDTLLQDNNFRWESRRGDDSNGWLLQRKKNDVCGIGREWAGDAGKCHEVESVYLELSQGKVVRIRARSPEYSPEKIGTSVRGWAECALEGLKSRHGNPSNVRIPLSKVKLSNFRKGERAPFVEWKKKTERISLCGSSIQSKLNLEVVIEESGIRGYGVR